MGVMVLEFSLIASAVPSQAAQQTKARRDGASLEQTCRDWARRNAKARGEATWANSTCSVSATA
jgi:hypothetical protein